MHSCEEESRYHKYRMYDLDYLLDFSDYRSVYDWVIDSQCMIHETVAVVRHH